MFKDKRYQEIAGIIIILISVIFLLSVFTYDINDYELASEDQSVNNIMGPLGALFSHLLRSAFGISAYIFAAMIGLVGWTIMKKGTIVHIMEKIFSLFFICISVSALISLISSQEYMLSGGFTGLYIHKFFMSILGKVGAFLVIIILNLVGLILVGLVSLSTVLEYTGGKKELYDKIKSIMGRFSSDESYEYKEGLPFNSIDDDLNQKKKKMPWIVKRKVIVYENGEDKKKNADPLKYLEMTVPIASESDSFAFSSYDPFEDPDFKTNQNQDIPAIEATPVITENQDDIFNSPVEQKEIKDAIPINRDLYSLDKCNNDFDKEMFDQLDSDIDSFEEEEDEKDVSIQIKSNRISNINLEIETVNETVPEDNFSEPEEVKVEDTENIEEPEKEPVKAQEKNNSQKTTINKETVVVQKVGNEEGDAVERIFDEIEMMKEYIVPTAYLNSSIPIDRESWKIEIRKNSMLLVNTLNDFGIESKVINVNRGPVITLYEMQIAAGIKVNKIVGLSDDIAMALAALRVRIVAPIPGKSAIGVEIPNTQRENVTLGDLIKSPEYQLETGSLKVALGKDILGKPVTLDLKRLPHLLIAGATGSGKSVCVNSIITSLIYNYDPNYVRFILVDPKMVELQLYNGLPHLLTPVITDPQIAPVALKWAIYEMERRYRLLSDLNTRDITRYNEKIEPYGNKYEKLPFIVTIIDELADLMMVASKEMEGYITRIAQKARAVGIHLVLATQRPSVDVITGIIKANFPARIAFQVAQRTDSRTILDQNGAEKLLGQGDLLYQSPVSSFPARMQGAFISEDEIEKIVAHLTKVGEPNYIDIEASIFDAEQSMIGEEDGDELFVEALKIVEESRKASASYLQRKLSIGYNRAARIIELMEDRGYVGPQQGSKPREVYI
ncbi:MAG: DNA translocase FtsK [bacterium]|nr:DNA translocase FtsK [bacterium]